MVELEAVAAEGDPIREASCLPIDIWCKDASGTRLLIRVKPLTGRPLAAASVSESIGWTIMQSCDLYVAEPFVVTMSPQFAADLTVQGSYDPPVLAGRHWGTKLLGGVGLDPGVDRGTLAPVGRPEHLFRIYILDELLGNRDRNTEGNILLVSDPVLPARLIPIDQSDCFGGKTCASDAVCMAASYGRRYATVYSVMEQVILEQPPEFVGREFDLIESCRASILAAVNSPVPEWYERAGITREAPALYLAARLDRIRDLARFEHWRGIGLMGQELKGKFPL